MSLSRGGAPVARTEGDTTMAGKQPKAPEPDDLKKRDLEGDEEDVEGHGMLPIDPSSARHLAGAREAEIRRSLQKHDLEMESRRPHKRER
jgi:hypothetical protein